MPNADLITTHVKNLNLHDNCGRVIVNVGLEYGSEIDKARKLLLDAALSHPSVYKDEEDPEVAPRVLLRNFGESTLDFEPWIYIKDVNDRFYIASDLRMAIYRACQEQNINMPFPQMDVWVQEMPPLTWKATGPRKRPSGSRRVR